MRLNRSLANAAIATTVVAGVVSVAGCRSKESPTSPSTLAPTTMPAAAVDGWTTIATADCASPKQICLVEARTTASQLEFRITSSGNIFAAGADGGIVAVWVDTDQSGGRLADGDLDACAGADAGLCDVGPPGSNPFVLWFPLDEVYERMPKAHRSVDLFLNSFDFVPNVGSGTQRARVPATGHLTYQVR
jgi:hypothetical protein